MCLFPPICLVNKGDPLHKEGRVLYLKGFNMIPPRGISGYTDYIKFIGKIKIVEATVNISYFTAIDARLKIPSFEVTNKKLILVMIYNLYYKRGATNDGLSFLFGCAGISVEAGGVWLARSGRSCGSESGAVPRSGEHRQGWRQLVKTAKGPSGLSSQQSE